MNLSKGVSLFGTRNRSLVLMLLSQIEESFPRELERLTGLPIATVTQVVDKLELEGVIAGSTRGSERRLRLNPRYFGAPELRALLDKQAGADKEVQSIVDSMRLRPRRKGKPIE